MIPTTQILLVDDDPVSRWAAAKALSRTSGIVIPEQPSDLYFLRPETFGLYIVDRHMTQAWETVWEHVRSEIVRMGLDVQIVEWTCATEGDDDGRRAYAVESIRKTGRGDELLPIVDRWLKTGRVVKGLMV